MKYWLEMGSGFAEQHGTTLLRIPGSSVLPPYRLPLCDAGNFKIKSFYG